MMFDDGAIIKHDDSTIMFVTDNLAQVFVFFIHFLPFRKIIEACLNLYTYTYVHHVLKKILSLWSIALVV